MVYRTDLDQTLNKTRFQSQLFVLTLNISKMATDTAIVSYYGRRIGNHTQAFEWHQFQLTLSDF